ncbi:pannexin-3-like [Nematolebias whitei]|uniref:pannexin-3-like n=1 Tax=Nematolebias whitei TaxID=451745 RepID=UPI00189A26D0|nr:pannexin-3-like [Nematolebias whitei]
MCPLHTEFVRHFQFFMDQAKKSRYFEYPLLERYMQCKQKSYFLVSMLFLRGFLLLTFMTSACLYLAYFYLSALLQDEFSCFVRTGTLRDHMWIPELVQCKIIGQLVFQVISVVNATIYILLAPFVIFSLIRLFVWDTTFISVYGVLPALDLINRQRLGCPLNDLNVLLLFLRANMAHLKSYGQMRALCSLAPPQASNATAVQGLNAMLTPEEMEEREEASMELAEEIGEAKEEGKFNLVDIMTILGAAQGRVLNCSKKKSLKEENMSLEPNNQCYHELKETAPSGHYHTFNGLNQCDNTRG